MGGGWRGGVCWPPAWLWLRRWPSRAADGCTCASSDGSEKAASVKVNLPVSVLETMAQSIEDEHFHDGKIEIGHDGINAEQSHAPCEHRSRDI